MALRPLLDLELLRTLVFLAEEGSFTRAAQRVGRTQSAVTLQIQKLEASVGQPLVIRGKGGPVEVNAQGRALVESARAMLKLNDEALRSLGSDAAPTTFRLATSSCYSPFYFNKAVEAVRAQFPNVMVELTEGYTCQLAPRIKDDIFDLMLCEGGHEPRNWPLTHVWRGPLQWIASASHDVHLRNPLPLSLTPKDCPWRPAWMDECYWRSAALDALERVGRPHQIVAAANSMEGLYAPVLAGEAVTISIGANLPKGLRVVGEDEGLPPLASCRVVLLKGRNAPQLLTEAFERAILANFDVR